MAARDTDPTDSAFYCRDNTYLISTLIVDLTILLGGNVELVGVDDVMNLVCDIHGLDGYVLANFVLGGAHDALNLLSGGAKVHAAAKWRRPPPPPW